MNDFSRFTQEVRKVTTELEKRHADAEAKERRIIELKALIKSSEQEIKKIEMEMHRDELEAKRLENDLDRLKQTVKDHAPDKRKGMFSL